MTGQAGRAGVRVALFDLDNTLFDRTDAYRLWATGYAETTGLSPSDVEWLCAIDEDGFADRHALWTSAKERFGLPEPVDQLLATYRRMYLESCQPDDTVHQRLRLLRERGWRIGIVSNGPMPEQAEKADRLGLLSLVDAFCGSGELGVEKPDPRIFEEAIRRCAAGRPLDRAHCWMVGDAPRPDVAGGRGVGFRTIWMHRGRRWNPADGDPPDVTVGSVTDATETILSTPE